MNPDPDYSAAYVILRTDAGDGLEGHGFTFTIGRGTEVVVAAVEALRPLVVGPRRRGDRAPTWARSGGRSSATASCAGSGPRRASIHLATAAVVNAVWDLVAKRAGKPRVAAARRHDAARRSSALVDFRYLTDALTPDEALGAARGGRRRRAPSATAELLARRLSGLHDLGRLARLRRRQGPAALPARRSPTAGRGSR